MFNERLKNMREETKLNQEEFAKLGGVKISAQANYERGIRYPTLEYLLKLSEAGFDVAYLVTGIVSDRNLNDDENELLSAYRDASSEKKYGLMLMARSIEKNPDDKEGQSPQDSDINRKADQKSDQDDILLCKKADIARNISSMKRVIPSLLGGILLISICLILFGEYAYLLSEDPLKANILSLTFFSIISIVLFVIGIIYAEKVFNVKDSNVARMRKIKSLFISK